MCVDIYTHMGQPREEGETKESYWSKESGKGLAAPWVIFTTQQGDIYPLIHY